MKNAEDIMTLYEERDLCRIISTSGRRSEVESSTLCAFACEIFGFIPKMHK